MLRSSFRVSNAIRTRLSILGLPPMPATRSATLRGAAKEEKPTNTPAEAKKKRKASRSEGEPPSNPGKKKPRTEKQDTPHSVQLPAIPLARGASPAIVPDVLSFSFTDAKQHLIGVDRRFEDMFEKMKCRPFENLEQVHPFRALVKSILGQQISWMAARSINHRFIRLYDPSLPEKPPESHATTLSFPTPQQVAETDLATLKTAGLSLRKAEYVKDLASRFSDGRLSTEKLIAADDTELAQMLLEVRGIGPWTVDMFAMFSLRRPDILPVGDLGVQRGLLRWFLSLHSPSNPFDISPAKIGGNPENDNGKDDLPAVGQDDDNRNKTSEDVLPSSVTPAAGPSTPLRKDKSKGSDLPPIPSPFTPSINKSLGRSANSNDVLPLPEGLSVSLLKSRLDGKKKIKGAFLTPKEMEELTECWRPYRSLGVYYMWALSEQKSA